MSATKENKRRAALEAKSHILLKKKKKQEELEVKIVICDSDDECSDDEEAVAEIISDETLCFDDDNAMHGNISMAESTCSAPIPTDNDQEERKLYGSSDEAKKNAATGNKAAICHDIEAKENCQESFDESFIPGNAPTIHPESSYDSNSQLVELSSSDARRAQNGPKNG